MRTDPGPQVVAGARARPQIPRRRGVSAPQQESRQREEHRDGEVEAPEQPAGGAAGVPGLESDVRDHHAHGRARAHALHGGQEAADPAHLLAIGHDHSLPCAAVLPDGSGTPEPPGASAQWVGRAGKPGP